MTNEQLKDICSTMERVLQNDFDDAWTVKPENKYTVSAYWAGNKRFDATFDSDFDCYIRTYDAVPLEILTEMCNALEKFTLDALLDEIEEPNL